MKRLITLSLIGSFLFVIAGVQPVLAAKPQAGSKPAPDLLGIDVSWPQCGKRLPTDHAFGIVGVNGGLANTTNPCLKDQLQWASRAKGGTAQESIQLYVNTANPGGLGTPSWPQHNVDPAGNTSPNPHGLCTGSDSLACAWQYGWNRALEDVRDRFSPAATQAGVNTSASHYLWWLDVETENTWKLTGSSFDFQSNVADLEGMTAYFKTLGIRVGLYSTAAQWGRIVGNAVSPTSNLNALPNWRPGGASLATSKEACKATSLTPGGKVVLTQFISKGLDYNYSCI